MTLKNVETSSLKLDADLEAIQHTIFLMDFLEKKKKRISNKLLLAYSFLAKLPVHGNSLAL
jgi:hypothetical protein